MTNVDESWGKTITNAIVTGLILSVFVVAMALGVLAEQGLWLWSFLAIPAVVLLCVLISVISRLVGMIRRSRPAAAPRPARDRVVLKRTAAGAGLLVAAAAGIALMGVGINVATDSPTCDPEVSSCVTVVDGVARGESDTSAGEQQVGNLLTGSVVFVPGLALLVGTYLGASRMVRSISAGRRTATE
ncbi:hypothetical protein AB0L86_22970 [Micromonospora musae]|uniref:hypothetical protein n=1 Tax=Micromonospora musae TaxID=1894970 RepID=UPI0034213C4D